MSFESLSLSAELHGNRSRSPYKGRSNNQKRSQEQSGNHSDNRTQAA